MKTCSADRKTWPWLLAVFGLWGLAFSIACFAIPFAPPSRAVEDPMLDAIFGSTRVFLGQKFYYEADNFFHEGVGYYKKKAFTNDVFQRLSSSLSPKAHTHLSGQRIREIMPWLYFTLKADPHNTEAISVTAFWLASELNRPELAEQVLKEAQADNPRSYAIRQEKGRLYVKTDRLSQAAAEFDVAIRLARSAPQWTNEQFRVDMAEMLIYRGLLYESRGATNQALADYADILQIYPGRKELRNRVAALSGGAKVNSPADTLQLLIDSRQHVCERENEDAGHKHTAPNGTRPDATHDSDADKDD